jgi:hypothetical protein
MRVGDGRTVGVPDGARVGETVGVKTTVKEGAGVDVIVALAVVNSAANASTVSARSVLNVGVAEPPIVFCIWRSAA